MACSARAPAKVIVGGEHWVVSGARALAAAAGLYALAVCRRSGEPGVRIVSSGFGEALATRDRADCGLQRGLCGLANMVARIYRGGAVCRVESEIPPGAGLGSSAAVAAALAAAYLGLYGSADRGAVNEAAFISEKIVHGNPSGVDNTVSVYGGFVLYRRGEPPQRLSPSLPPDTRLLIVESGVARSTRQAVEAFQGFLQDLGELGDKMLKLADSIVADMARAVAAGEVERLGRLMYLMHGLLAGMGVSHPRLDEIVHIARSRAALGAKLTGAGMGGSAIILCRGDNCRVVSDALRSRGYRVRNVGLGVEGVTLDCRWP